MKNQIFIPRIFYLFQISSKMKRPRENLPYRNLYLLAISVVKTTLFKSIQASVDERIKEHHVLNGWKELSGYRDIVWGFGYCICLNNDCKIRIQPKNNFSKNCDRVFGKQSLCKKCKKKRRTTPSNAQKNARTSRKKRALEAGLKHKTCDTEDRFAEWVQCEFNKYGWEVIILPESRLNDILVRYRKWDEGVYIGIQLKTDGAYHENGTYKNDVVTGQKGKFAKCWGYSHPNHIQLLFGKFRKENENDEKVTLWQMSGEEADNANNSTICVNMRNEVGYTKGKNKESFRSSCISPNFKEFFETCENLYTLKKLKLKKLWTYNEAFLCVDPENSACKEVALMIALSENKLIHDAKLEFPVGNAHIYDCFQNLQGEKRYQSKSIDIKRGGVSLCHEVNGIRGVPYTESSEFDSFIFGKLICKQGKYFVIHLVVDKMTGLKYADGAGSMSLQYNTSKVKELLENTCVNMKSGIKNKMYEEGSFQMQVSEIHASETLPENLLENVCDHL